MRRLVFTLPLLALAAAGCGPAATSNSAKQFSGTKQGVAQAIDDFSKATRDSDEKKICSSLLSRALVLRLNSAHSTCTKAVSDQLDAAGDPKINVKTITVTGDRAQASVTSKVDGHDRRQTLLLVREGGSWRLAGAQ